MDIWDDDIGPWCSDDQRRRFKSQITTMPVQNETKEITQTIQSTIGGRRLLMPKLKLHQLSPGQPIKQQYVNQNILIKSPKERHFLPQLSLIKMKPQKPKQSHKNSEIHVIFEIEKIIRRNQNYKPAYKNTTSTIL